MASRQSLEKSHFQTQSHPHNFPYFPLTPTSTSTTTPFMLVPLMTNPNANPETYSVSAPAATLKPLEPVPSNPITSSIQSLKPGEVRRSVVTFSTSVNSNPVDEVLQYNRSPVATSSKFKESRAMHKLTQSYDLQGNPIDKNYLFPNYNELNEIKKSGFSKTPRAQISSLDFTTLPKYNAATELRSSQATLNELDNLKKDSKVGSTVFTQAPVTGSVDPVLDEILRKYRTNPLETGLGDKNVQMPPSYKNDVIEQNKSSQNVTSNQIGSLTSMLKTAPISKNDLHSVHSVAEKKSLSHDFTAGYAQPVQGGSQHKATHVHSHSSSGINFKFSNLTISVVDNSPERQGGIGNIIVSDTRERTSPQKEINNTTQAKDNLNKENLGGQMLIVDSLKDIGYSKTDNKAYKDNLDDLYSRKVPDNNLTQYNNSYAYNTNVVTNLSEHAGALSKGDYHYTNKRYDNDQRIPSRDIYYPQTNWTQQSNYDAKLEKTMERDYKMHENVKLEREKKTVQHHWEGLSNTDTRISPSPNKFKEDVQPNQVNSQEEHCKHNNHEKSTKTKENKHVENLEVKKSGKKSHVLVHGVTVGLVVMILSWLYLIMVEESQE